MEKRILNKMIENNDGVLSNDFILEQSRIVNKLNKLKWNIMVFIMNLNVEMLVNTKATEK